MWVTGKVMKAISVQKHNANPCLDTLRSDCQLCIILFQPKDCNFQMYLIYINLNKISAALFKCKWRLQHWSGPAAATLLAPIHHKSPVAALPVPMQGSVCLHGSVSLNANLSDLHLKVTRVFTCK